MYEEIAKKYGLLNIMLFGSVLTDAFHEDSDVDIAILAEEPLSLIDIMDIEMCFEKHFNRAVDVVDLQGERVDLFLKINILNTGKSVYSIDDNKSLEVLIEKIDQYYRLNETYFSFRRRDLLC